MLKVLLCILFLAPSLINYSRPCGQVEGGRVWRSPLDIWTFRASWIRIAWLQIVTCLNFWEKVAHKQFNRNIKKYHLIVTRKMFGLISLKMFFFSSSSFLLWRVSLTRVCLCRCIWRGMSLKMPVLIVNVLFCYFIVTPALSSVWWVLCLYFLVFTFFVFTFLCLCCCVFICLCSFFVFIFCVCIVVFIFLCLCCCVYIFCVCVLLCLYFLCLCCCVWSGGHWAAHALEATAATTLTNSLLVAVVLIFNDLLYIQTNKFDWHNWKSRSLSL